MNLKTKQQVLEQVLAATEMLLDAWQGDRLDCDDFAELMAMAKAEDDWDQVAAIALATACILEDERDKEIPF